jgi:hypothetical protein
MWDANVPIIEFAMQHASGILFILYTRMLSSEEGKKIRSEGAQVYGGAESNYVHYKDAPNGERNVCIEDPF